MRKAWTPEQRDYLDRLSIWVDRTHQQAKLALDGSGAELGRMSVAFADAIDASIAEIQEFTVAELLYAVRSTYGGTLRPELLQDARGKWLETVTQRKACEYSGKTPRRIKQLIADGTLECRGGKGNRRIVTSSLTRQYPPEK